MRTFLGPLLIIALMGICAGALVGFTRAFGTMHSMGDSLMVGAFPFLIGTVALAAVEVTSAINQARTEQIAAIERLIEATKSK